MRNVSNCNFYSYSEEDRGWKIEDSAANLPKPVGSNTIPAGLAEAGMPNPRCGVAWVSVLAYPCRFSKWEGLSHQMKPQHRQRHLRRAIANHLAIAGEIEGSCVVFRF